VACRQLWQGLNQCHLTLGAAASPKCPHTSRTSGLSLHPSYTCLFTKCSPLVHHVFAAGLLVHYLSTTWSSLVYPLFISSSSVHANVPHCHTQYIPVLSIFIPYVPPAFCLAEMCVLTKTYTSACSALATHTHKTYSVQDPHIL